MQESNPRIAVLQTAALPLGEWRESYARGGIRTPKSLLLGQLHKPFCYSGKAEKTGFEPIRSCDRTIFRIVAPTNERLLQADTAGLDPAPDYLRTCFRDRGGTLRFTYPNGRQKI